MQQKFCNQTEFAAMLGVHRSYVTRLKKAGRLVLTADGRVNVQASLARVQETADPGSAKATGTATSEFKRWRALRINYLARMAKLNYEVAKRDQIPAKEVCYFITDLGTSFRCGMESLRDRISSELAACTTTEEVHAALGLEYEKILQNLDAKIGGWR